MAKRQHGGTETWLRRPIRIHDKKDDDEKQDKCLLLSDVNSEERVRSKNKLIYSPHAHSTKNATPNSYPKNACKEESVIRKLEIPAKTPMLSERKRDGGLNVSGAHV